MPVDFVTLRDEYLEDAAALVAARYRTERKHVPCLPPRYESPDSLLPLLRGLLNQVPGVAAVRGNRLAGFLLGQIVPEFKGKRGVYIPEWAHGSEAEDLQAVYHGMYAHLSALWAANGCYVHAITTMAHEPVMSFGTRRR